MMRASRADRGATNSWRRGAQRRAHARALLKRRRILSVSPRDRQARGLNVSQADSLAQAGQEGAAPRGTSRMMKPRRLSATIANLLGLTRSTVSFADRRLQC